MGNSGEYRILVMTDHLPWGHRSIAKAIYSYLSDRQAENRFSVHFRQIETAKGESGILLYRFVYRHFPKLGKLGFRIENNTKVKRLSVYFRDRVLPKIKDAVTELNPDLVISTYAPISTTLARWREAEALKFKLWTVVADPWTTLSASIVPGADVHLVYDGVMVGVARDQGVDENSVKATGWWVRPEMYREFDREEARRKLGFTDDRPVIFVGGGSLGTNSLVKLLPALSAIDGKAGFVFNTGTDKKAFKAVEEYRKKLEASGKGDSLAVRNLGWIENMAEVLSACDIVFGKAGPNFLFDAIAAKKPFVSITHIGGQEDGNIEIIRTKKLGWVKEKNGELLDFLKEYLKDPAWHHGRFAGEIEAEAESNRKSLPQILELINSLRDE